MASDTSQTIDNKSLLDLYLKDRSQQNDFDLMIGVAIKWGGYFGVVHDSDVYDSLSLIRLNEPGSVGLICRSGSNIKRVSKVST